MSGKKNKALEIYFSGAFFFKNGLDERHCQLVHFCNTNCCTAFVETVVLLSHKDPDSHIHVKVEYGEGKDKVPEDEPEPAKNREYALTR